VDVVEQASQGPLLLVAPQPLGQAAHHCLHGVHMLEQVGVFDPLLYFLQSLFPIHVNTSLWAGTIPYISSFMQGWGCRNIPSQAKYQTAQATLCSRAVCL